MVDRERRTKKSANNLYKFFYYLGVSIWGYCVLYDKRFFPSALGGEGSLYKCHVDYPYIPIEYRTGMRAYYLVQLGFYFESIVRMIVWQGLTRDIVEMLLHEFITIFLIGGSYLVNVWEVGSVILHLHNVSDVLIMLSKVLGETNYAGSSACVFVSAMAVWFYTRIVLLPWIAWYSARQPIYMNHMNDIILPFFGYLLYCLVMMHIFWFYMFYKIIHHYMTKGEANDMIEADAYGKDDVENKDDNYNKVADNA